MSRLPNLSISCTGVSSLSAIIKRGSFSADSCPSLVKHVSCQIIPSSYLILPKTSPLLYTFSKWRDTFVTRHLTLDWNTQPKPLTSESEIKFESTLWPFRKNSEKKWTNCQNDQWKLWEQQARVHASEMEFESTLLLCLNSAQDIARPLMLNPLWVRISKDKLSGSKSTHCHKKVSHIFWILFSHHFFDIFF